MNKFTKTYNVQPNNSQRATIKRVFNATVISALAEGKAVEVLINPAMNNNIYVNIRIDGAFAGSRIIGQRGAVISNN